MNAYKDFLNNIEDPALKDANLGNIPKGFRLINNTTNECWSLEDNGGHIGKKFNSKFEALYDVWDNLDN